jgi:hypothetical protein
VTVVTPHERVGTIKTAASSLCVFGFWKAQSVYGFAAELGAGVAWGLKDILSTHHGVLADVRSYFSRHLLNLGLNLQRRSTVKTKHKKESSPYISAARRWIIF